MLSFYDPTTGQFITRDPITPITRSAYGYVGGNPVNATDPSGLIWPFDEDDNTFLSGTCIAVGNNGCDNSGNQEFAAQFYSGMLNGMTFGQGQKILNAAGKGAYVQQGSGAYTGGAAFGWLIETPFAFSSRGSVAGFSRLSLYSGAELTAETCARSIDIGCLVSATTTVGGYFAGPAFSPLRFGRFWPGIWMAGGLSWIFELVSRMSESLYAVEQRNC